MIDFTIETPVSRPVEEVFGFVTDPEKLPAWQTNTVSAERLDEEPLRIGSRLREVHRAPGGRELAQVVEVVELQPNRVFALKVIEGPVPVDARIGFETTASGTLVRFRAHGRLRGPLRLAEPLLRPLMRRQIAAHCARLEQALERPA